MKSTFVKRVSLDFKIYIMQKNNTEIKNVISTFIKKPANEISEKTVIDKTVVQGSILIHRMYAEIADLGFEIDNYNDIKTFSDLLKKINSNETTSNIIAVNQLIPNNYELSDNNSIGIDIEKVSNFKKVLDYREDNFYKQNFTDKEISHTLLQPDVLQSFAGKFAAKEAIVKANNTFLNLPFNQIEILYNDEGKPSFQNLHISISHSDDTAIAVAVLIAKNDAVSNLRNEVEITPSNNRMFKIISVLSILIAIFSLIYSVFVK